MSEQQREELAYAIGVQAYIWGYPVVINENRSRVGMAGGTEIIPHMLRAPLNTFVHAKELLTPDFEDVQSPNNDTLYTTAWLDLRDEPMVMHVPNMNGRYYTYQFLDAYTNNFTYVSQRTRGFKEMDIAICGPGHSGALPSGLERIDAPTPTVFIIGRLGVDGPDDVPAVHALQDEMFLGPLSGWAERRVAAPRVAQPSGHTGPLAFFEDLGDLIADNPPPPHDAGLLGLFAQIGLTVDHGFDPTTLDEPTRRALERVVADGEDMIAGAAQGLGSEMNGWQLPPVATEYFGTDYFYRAAVGWQSMYVNDPIEAYYPPIYTDLDGAQLDGSAGSYEIRFPAGHLPPVDAFWSITLYDLERRLMVANDIERYSIGDRTPGLVHGDDGALTITIGHNAPDGDARANWLPAPAAPFYLLMRLYLPSMEVLNGAYEIPGIHPLR